MKQLCNCTTQSDSTSWPHSWNCPFAQFVEGKLKQRHLEDCTAQTADDVLKGAGGTTPPLPKQRYPVNYRYDALEPEFLKLMARIGGIADMKYAHLGGLFNYKNYRLDGDKGPINHIYEHLRQYRTGERYDNDSSGDRMFHLAAIAYNAMMEFWYATSWDGAPKGPQLGEDIKDAGTEDVAGGLHRDTVYRPGLRPKS